MTFRDLELAIGCGKCGVDVGEMCRTTTGRRASLAHSVRATPVYEAWRQGFYDGQKDIILSHDEGDERYIDARRKDLR